MAKKFINYLGIDFGSSKIGLAFADGQSKLALPLKVIAKQDWSETLTKIIQTYQVEQIIVGRPQSKLASNTSLTLVNNFVTELKKVTSLPIILEDERLSTKQAKHTTASRQADDAVAAAIILQSYLDRHESI